MLEELSNRKLGLPSLPEVNRSVRVPTGTGWLRRLLVFVGPAFLVSVGYIDPGNWATDLEGGAKFGYALLWVILLSNLMAILLQLLAARLGLATERDLAQACRDYYKRPAAVALWLLCEVAIIACDLAEVVGSAVALNLLFRIPLVWGVLITGTDVLILLALLHTGFRKLEAVVLTLVATVGACFAINVFLCRPDWGAAALGTVVPTLPGKDSLYIALAIIGATVMPHNLYLHSSIVQTRAVDRSPEGVRSAMAFNTVDTLIALMAAFLVNAAILIVSAAVFARRGLVVTELQQAHSLLRPLLGGAAATAFAVALLASGQSSTITGTLAGQIVMEGFVGLRLAPWLRRLITRGLAIIPAVLLIGASGGRDTLWLLVLSQVVLSMQLSFATVPLVMFTSDRQRMGEFVNPPWMTVLAWITCAVIAGLNVWLIWQKIGPVWLGAAAGACLAFAAWVHFGYREPVPQAHAAAQPAGS